MVICYGELLRELQGDLASHNIFQEQLEAQELLCHMAKCNKAQLLANARDTVPESVETAVRQALAQRISGKPLPYILEQWDFYGMSFQLNSHTLIPRADTEVLVDRAIAIGRSYPPETTLRILDLCAGSGCIGIAVAKHLPHSQVVLGEISPEAREICEKNAQFHGLGDRVSTMELDALGPSPWTQEFHLLLSNPPYISQQEMTALPSTVYDHEPHLALSGGEDGYDFYHSIGSLWHCCLQPQGTILFEVGHTQGDKVKKLLEKQGFVHIQHHLDTQNIPRVIEGQHP